MVVDLLWCEDSAVVQNLKFDASCSADSHFGNITLNPILGDDMVFSNALCVSAPLVQERCLRIAGASALHLAENETLVIKSMVFEAILTNGNISAAMPPAGTPGSGYLAIETQVAAIESGGQSSGVQLADLRPPIIGDCWALPRYCTVTNTTSLISWADAITFSDGSVDFLTPVPIHESISALDLPQTRTILVQDQAGNKGQCSQRFMANLQLTANNSLLWAGRLPTNLPTIGSSSNRWSRTAAVALLRPAGSTEPVTSRNDAAPFSLLAPAVGNYQYLRFVLEAPPGQPFVVRTPEGSYGGQFYFNMTWLPVNNEGNGQSVPFTCGNSLGLRLQFESKPAIVQQQQPRSSIRSIADSAIIAEEPGEFRQDSWLAYEALDVNPSTGAIKIVNARTAGLFNMNFQFDSMVLTLVMPDGCAINASSRYLTEESQIWLRFEMPSNTPDSQLADLQLVAPLDTAPPVFLQCPASSSILRNTTWVGQNFTTVSWTPPQASDDSGRTVTITASHQPGSIFYLKPPNVTQIQNVTYVAQDTFGNQAVCLIQVQVVDSEPPTSNLQLQRAFELPSTSETWNVTLPTEALWPTVRRDNSGQIVAVISPNAPTTLLVGTHQVPVVLRDVYGNTNSTNVTVRIVDTTPPVFTYCPDNIEVPATFTSGDSEFSMVSWRAPAFTDNDYDGPGGQRPLHFEINYESGSSFAVGTTTIVARVTDASNLTATCEFNVTVVPGAASAAVQNGLAPGTVAGIVIGVAVILVVVVVIVVRRIIRNRARKPQNWDEIFQLMEQFQEETQVDGQRRSAKGLRPKYPREVPRSSVVLLDELGKGAFGLVWKGVYRELRGHVSYLVAIKSLHSTGTDQERTELLSEAAILAQFDSNFVVRLIGVVTVGAPVLMLVEFAEFGSLKSFLERQKKVLAADVLMLWAGDVAEGLDHVHSLGFLHRDVAARNVLVSSELRCKVSDFGLAREVDDNRLYYRSRGGQLPVRWTAPEALDSHVFNKKTDVYSYGILIYELWTAAKLPYEGWNNTRVWTEVTNGYRLPQPAGCDAAVYAVMEDCWQREPSRRPEMQELVARFRQLLEVEDKKSGSDSGVEGESVSRSRGRVQNSLKAIAAQQPRVSSSSGAGSGYAGAAAGSSRGVADSAETTGSSSPSKVQKHWLKEDWLPSEEAGGASYGEKSSERQQTSNDSIGVDMREMKMDQNQAASGSLGIAVRVLQALRGRTAVKRLSDLGRVSHLPDARGDWQPLQQFSREGVEGADSLGTVVSRGSEHVYQYERTGAGPAQGGGAAEPRTLAFVAGSSESHMNRGEDEVSF